MYDLFKLKSPIGRSYNTDPEDVRKTKKALSDLGYYEEPDFGITPYPNTSMMDGLENFQRDFGLRLDGVMKPGGETAQMLGSVNHINAQNLQNLGRNGDSILAHITPGKARLLKRKGGAGTINPKTGLLEFSKESKKEGEYIWRTVGDGKVRSSHADRDGQVFSWDDAPEGGHPGEALNCRCTAEDIVDNKRCEELSRLIKAMEFNLKKARERQTKASNIFNTALNALNAREEECDKQFDEFIPNVVKEGVEGGATGAAIGGALGGPAGALAGAGAGAVKGAASAAIKEGKYIYDACMINIDNSQEKVDYEKARQELKSAEFWKNAHQEDWKAYRDEYEQIGCRA